MRIIQDWIEQLGTSSAERAYGIAVDGSGNVYVAGSTSGALEGSNAGSYDAWLAKYDAKGVQQWVEQLGSWASDSPSSTPYVEPAT